MSGKLIAGLIFAALALILAGFGLAMAFEALAIWTGKSSTISELAATAIRAHPHVALFWTFIAGLVIGALVTHLTLWYSLP